MEVASDDMEEKESLLNGTDSNSVEIRVDDHGATIDENVGSAADLDDVFRDYILVYKEVSRQYKNGRKSVRWSRALPK